MNKVKTIIKTKIGEEKAAKLRRVWRGVSVVKNIICWTMVAVLVFLVVTFLLERVNGGTPSVFGYKIYRVETPSMEPTLMVGDVILSKDISGAEDIEMGDIITFQGDSRFNNHRVTHRVYTPPYKGASGETVVVTKGDANDVADGEVRLKDVQSKMVRKLAFLTGLYAFFFSPWGLIIFIALMILIFFDEVMNIIHISIGKYDEKEKEESIGEIIERIQREDKEKEEKKQAERAILNEYADDAFEQTGEKEDLEDPDPEHIEEE